MGYHLKSLIFIFFINRFYSFRHEDNPLTGNPPVFRPNSDKICKVELFSNVSLHGYGQVEEYLYEAPQKCLCEMMNPSTRVVLDFIGSVAGVQYDRVGALWFDGIEILRTTTPEPSIDGINWHIEKDLTEYASIFMKTNVTASLSIPNIVTLTYTGVLKVSISITIFVQNENHSEQRDDNNFPVILALSEPVEQGSFPWSRMSLHSDEKLLYEFSLPFKNTEFLFVDVYMSAHRNEEFWYADAPGGSSYREIMVFVDGRIAGIAYPFPVIYTGGINPLLWTPLTGILSFDIPPYRFDLSPFCGLLNDGNNHTMEVQIFGNSGGVWYVSPVLVAYTNNKYSVLAGEVEYSRSDIVPSIDIAHEKPNMTYTSGQHSFVSKGWIKKGKGDKVFCEVSSSLRSENLIDDKGIASGFLFGLMTTEFYSLKDPLHKSMLHERQQYFPYWINTTYEENADTFSLNATVNISRFVTETWGYKDGEELGGNEKGDVVTLTWLNHINSVARYNRSLTNHSKVYDEFDRASEYFYIQVNDLPKLGLFQGIESENTQSENEKNYVGNIVKTKVVTADKDSFFFPILLDDACYSCNLKAADGLLTDHRFNYDCEFPHGVSFCGSDVCRQASYTPKNHKGRVLQSENSDFIREPNQVHNTKTDCSESTDDVNCNVQQSWFTARIPLISFQQKLLTTKNLRRGNDESQTFHSPNAFVSNAQHQVEIPNHSSAD